MDHDALPALHEAMEAAGFHDADRALAALDRAEAALPHRFHQSRDAIGAARDAARAADWERCWAAAYQAMQTLTGPFPPNIHKCAAQPDNATPFVHVVCTCGANVPPGARFCPQCGTRSA